MNGKLHDIFENYRARHDEHHKLCVPSPARPYQGHELDPAK